MSPFEAPLYPEQKFAKLYTSWLDSRIPTAHYEQKNATSPELSVRHFADLWSVYAYTHIHGHIIIFARVSECHVLCYVCV